MRITPSVYDRQSRRSTQIINFSIPPNLSHYLGTLTHNTFFEFIYMSACTENLFYRALDGQAFKTMKEFYMASRPDYTFVNVKLSKKDMSKVADFCEQYNNQWLEIVDDICELGYKVSISYVDKQNAYVVSVSGSARSGYNINQTLTSWASELSECIQIAGYKVLSMMRNKDWKEFEVEDEVWG